MSANNPMASASCKCGHPHVTRDGAASCVGHSKRTGSPCPQARIPGATVCYWHGGNAPQVRRCAQARIEALRTPAVAYLGYLLAQREFPSAGLGAAKDVLDRVDGKAAEVVRMIDTTEHDYAEFRAKQRQYAEAAVARKRR